MSAATSSFALQAPYAHTTSIRMKLHPWINLLIFVSFFLSIHEFAASQHWLKTDKAELHSLAQDEASGHATRQIGFLILGGLGVALLLQPAREPTSPRPLLLFPLCMLLLWALISVGWSADSGVTLKRQIILVCMLLGAAGLVKRFTLNELVQIAICQTVLVILVGIVAEAILHPVLPITDGEYRFAGTLHPNHMGMNASLLLLCSLFAVRIQNDRRFFLLAGVAIATLLMSKSRTALSSAVVGTMVFLVLAYPRKRMALVLIVLLISGIAMAVVATDAFSNLGQTVLMNRGSSDPTTLTGRTMIWQFAFEKISDDWGRMFTGFGYGAFWTPEMAAALSQRASFALSEGHNAYLDVMLQLGFPGLGLYLWCLIGTLCVYLAAAKRSASPQAALAAGLLCFTLNHQLAESAMTAPGLPTLVLWCLIASAALGQTGDARGEENRHV